MLEDEDTDVVGEAGRCPGGAFKEVVKDIEAVALGVVGRDIGLRVVSNAPEVLRPQSHNPGQAEVGVRQEGRIGKSRREGIDERAQRWYHFPHEEISFRMACNYPSGYEISSYFLPGQPSKITDLSFRKICDSSVGQPMANS